MTAAVQGRQTFVWLDVARAVAALIVLGGHLRAYVFDDFVSAGHVGSVWKLFYLITSLQNQAVIVFFVLSGFLISKSISDQADSDKWSWRQYAFKRLSRLWIVLLPALILTVIWDQLGIRLTGSGLYAGSLNIVNHSTPVGPLSYSLTTFLGNVGFLQTIAVPTFGTDAPLWSLANEFWYYVLFPLFFFVFRTTYSLTVRTGLLIAAAILCTFFLRAQLLLGLVWLLGFGAYLLNRYLNGQPYWLRLLCVLVTATLFPVAIVASKFIHISDLTQDFITGFSFTALLIPLASFGAWSIIARPAKFCAGFSYSLYLLHFPFLAFLTSALLANRRVAPGPTGLLTFALLFAAALAYSYAVSLVFERNTGSLQAFIMSLVVKRRPRTTPVKIALRTE